MARNEPDAKIETLAELDSFFDRLAQKVADNPRPLVVTVAVVLLAALTLSILVTIQEDRRASATEAVGRVQAEFLEAMGAPLLSPNFAEPANAEVARATRADYAARLQAAADEHAGTEAAAAGRLEAGTLLSDIGEEEAARVQWQAAADEAPADSALRGGALFRLAVSYEATDAAQALRLYESASRIDDFPAAPMALAHAARTALDADDADRALALYAQLEAAAEDGRIEAPPFVAARLRELRAAHGNGSQP